MDLFVDCLWLIIGLALLYFGGEWLVKGAREISLMMGISPLAVGLTVVAFGTSAPELLVSLQANLLDPPKGDIALGNVVGSNICNIALILGIGAAIRPMSVHRQVIKREMPFLLVISVVFILLLRDGQIQQVEGFCLFAAVIAYTALSLREARRAGLGEQAVTSESKEEVAKSSNTGTFANIGLLLAGIGALVIGADRLVLGGSNIARHFNVPEATIALTIVAFGTSLPELATSIVAAIRRQGDIILGNAVGSCIFNVLCVVGLTSSISPLSRTSELRNWDLGVMLAFTLIVFPFVWRDRLLGRRQGVILLFGYASYVCYLGLR
ncbi:MAG: sodium:calcium antiporter [Verrucomicrobia bacterium]|nr:MAG: sodium:calcium antiporter [Verrucomicrobiota bacterium]